MKNPYRSAISGILFIAILLLPCPAAQQESNATGEIKILGQDITKITFTKIGIVNPGESEADFTKEIENPAEIVELPAGKYSINRIELKGGYYTSPNISIIISEDKATELKTGGPLTQAITAQKQSRYLQLRYTLTGIGGESYVEPTRQEKIGFAVYKADKLVDSGNLEYG